MKYYMHAKITVTIDIEMDIGVIFIETSDMAWGLT